MGRIGSAFSAQETITLNQLSDVTITSPADNDLLAYDNDTSSWINQTPSQAGLDSRYVNVTGDTMTGDLTLPNLSVTGYADFTGIANPAAPAAGTARFHSATMQGFTRFEQDNEASTNLTLGRDNVLVAKNTSGSDIAKGRAVYVTGSTGNVPNIALAKADSITTLPAMGMTLDAIGNNNFGQVMKLGVIGMFDTSAFTTGDRLFVSAATAGALTATRPALPNYVQRVGSVLVSGVGNGSLSVSMAPFIGSEETGTNNATFSVGQLVSTVATGTSPLSVTSTTKVTNLNADQVDGADLSTSTSLGTSDILIPSQNAVKSYVDTVAQGLSPKPSALVGTTAALPTYIYSNGASGVGATITAVATGVVAVDGQNLALNDVVLVKDETAANAPYNGLYTVTVAGAVGIALVLTRHTSMDLTSEFSGGYVFVESGTVNTAAGFVCTNTGNITVGTTAVSFTQFSGAGEITAGTGMTKTGNTLDVVGTASRIVANADSIDIDSGYVGQTSITTLGTIGTGTWNATAIAWAKVDKTGSSLADLATKSAGALDSGNLAWARLPGSPGGTWSIGGTLVVSGGDVVLKGSIFPGYAGTDGVAYISGNATGIGINTGTPGALLEISKATTPETRTTWTTTSSYGHFRLFEGTTEIGGMQGIGSAFATVDRRNDLELFSVSGDISFWPGNTQQVTFKSGGNVGIGTVAPSTKQEIYNATYNHHYTKSSIATGTTADLFSVATQVAGGILIQVVYSAHMTSGGNLGGGYMLIGVYGDNAPVVIAENHLRADFKLVVADILRGAKVQFANTSGLTATIVVCQIHIIAASQDGAGGEGTTTYTEY